MRRTFVALLIVALGVCALGVCVFHVALDLAWVDSVYFVITTMTTVGYGDISLLDASPALKLFGNGLMLVGAASMAAVFGLITDYLLHAQLERMFGPRRWKMKDHIILCGLGNVGVRVLEQLTHLGEQVIVIEKEEDNRFLDVARLVKVPVIHGDMRNMAFLEQANIAQAKAIIAAGNDDIANLEAALNARSARPDIRVVLRIFDTNLAQKLQTAFGINTAFSTSALAAPGFAMAAVDPDVVGSFYVDGELMTNVELSITPGSPLDGMTSDQLRQRGDVSILSHVCRRTGRRDWHPAEPFVMAAEDRLVVSVTKAFYRELKQLNRI